MPQVNRKTGYELALVQNVGLLKENGYLRQLLRAVGAKADIGEVDEFITREWSREFDGVFARHAKGNVEDEARAAWRDFLATIPDAAYFQSLKPHGGKPGPARILMIAGGGGIGDALMYTPLLAELKSKFAPCEIAFFCMIPAAADLLKGNGLVDAVLAGEWVSSMQHLRALQELDLFDLVVFSHCFFPRYVLCKNSRLAREDLRRFFLGNNAIADMLALFSSNFGSNLLDRMLSLHYLDVLGIATGLPIRAENPLIFAPDPQALASVANLNLPARYVTVRDGANAYDSKIAHELGATRTNKQLPAAQWHAIAARLQKEGLAAVQVGGESDPAIDGAVRDLRGKTSLSELCFVMKNAVAHIDTEGGLVHFARAVHAPAVAIFGATSPSLFSYPQNANIYSPECSSCFYTDRSWIAKCPRGTEGPDCTSDLDIEAIIEPVRETEHARRDERYRLMACETAAGRPQDEIVAGHLKRFLSAPNAAPKIAFIGAPDALGALGDMDPDIVPIGPQPDRRTNPAATQDAPAGSLWNLPLNSGSYDAVIARDVLDRTSFKRPALAELLRLLRPGGLLVADLAMKTPPPHATRDRNEILDDLLVTAGKGESTVIALRREA